MKDAKAIERRFIETQDKLLTWVPQAETGKTEAGFTYMPPSSAGSPPGPSRDELRGWEKALAWVLGKSD